MFADDTVISVRVMSTRKKNGSDGGWRGVLETRNESLLQQDRMHVCKRRGNRL